jgi:tetratricopeptide (TPR) repeat protein
MGFKPDSSNEGPKGWEKKLVALEAEADHAPLGFRGQPLNKAGDLCLKADDHERALQYYGRAIDALLQDEHPEAARGVAGKIIRIHPGAIRTLYTLTWLDLAAHHIASALTHLRDYTEAAKRGGQRSRAADAIVEMAKSVREREFLNAAGDALGGLGFDELADRVHAWAASGGSPDAIHDDEEFRTQCVQAAIGSNAQRKAGGPPA